VPNLVSENEKMDSKSDLSLLANEQRIGFVGRVFGSKENAVLYLASIIILVVLTILTVFMFVDPGMRSDILKYVGAIGIAAIGYITGVASK